MKKLTKSNHLKIYSYLLKIRRFEERSAQLYGMGHIGGFCHLYIGQEAVVVGVLMTIKKNDSVVTTYRDHGHMIARGLNPKKIKKVIKKEKYKIILFFKTTDLFILKLTNQKLIVYVNI